MYRCKYAQFFFRSTMSTSSTLYEQTFHAMLYKVFFFSADQYLMPGHHLMILIHHEATLKNIELRALCFAWPIFNNIIPWVHVGYKTVDIQQAQVE